MSLSVDQMTYWEAPVQDFPLHLYIHSPDIVFQALVNQTQFVYPIMQLAYDTVTTGAYTDIREGMTLLVGTSAGSDDLGRIRVRRDPTSGVVATTTLLYFSRSSQGVGDGEVNLSNNVHITVLDQYPVVSVIPYITEEGVIYKDGAVAWSSARSGRPVANMGGDVLKIIPIDETDVDIDFGQTASYKTHPSATSTITYAWNFEDGTPNTSTSATPTVNFPKGKRWVHLTVTDSRGTTKTSHRLVVVTDVDDPDLIKLWNVDSWVERITGQEISIQVDEPLSYTDYPDGTEVMICTLEHADQVGLADRKHMLFSGWLHDEIDRVEANEQGITSRLSFNLIDASGKMKLLPSFPEDVDRKASPSSWAEMAGLNPDRVLHYRLDRHSTILDRCDFVWSGELDNYAIRGLRCDGGNFANEAEFISQAIAYQLTCDINNRLIQRQDPQLAPTSAQNTAYSIGFSRSTATTLDLDPEHWQNYNYSYKRAPRVHFNWGESLLRSTEDMESDVVLETVFVVAVGLAPSQGTNESSTTRQISRNINEFRMRVGNYYRARQNALVDNFQFDLLPMRHAIHPANMEWININIPAEVSGHRGREWTNRKVLPIEISYDVDIVNRIRTATVSVEPEVTNGTPATRYIPKSSTTANWVFDLPEYTIGDWVYEPAPLDLIPENTGELPVKVWGFSADNPIHIARSVSIDYGTKVITYEDLGDLGITGTGIWGRSDPHNYYRKFILTSEGLWRIEDLWETNPSAVLVATNLQMFGSATAVGHEFFMTHNDKQGWIAVLSGFNAVALTFDYGESWELVTVNGAAAAFDTNPISTTSTEGLLSMCLVGWNSSSDGRMYAIQYLGSGVHALYKSINWGRNWTTVLANMGFGNWARMDIEIPYKRGDGTPNRDDGDLLMYASGGTGGSGGASARTSVDGGLTWGSVWQKLNANETYYHVWANSSITSFTHNGDLIAYSAILSSSGSTINESDDQGATAAYVRGVATNVGYKATNVFGFAASDQFLVAFSPRGRSGAASTVQFTDNRGANWYDITPAFFTNGHAAYFEGDLSDLIPYRG